eukprot:5984423-Karenia_brevis.AAC.1
MIGRAPGFFEKDFSKHDKKAYSRYDVFDDDAYTSCDHVGKNCAKGCDPAFVDLKCESNQFNYQPLVSVINDAKSFASLVSASWMPALHQAWPPHIPIHEFARVFISSIDCVDIRDLSCGSELIISIDGGGGSYVSPDQKGPATWAFSVFNTKQNGCLEHLGYFGGTLLDSAAFISWPVLDSFYSEMCAFMWAMVWVLQNRSAIYVGQGIWNFKNMNPCIAW